MIANLSMKKLCIIIPAYNEEKRIGRTLQEYLAFFNDLKQRRVLNYEMIVVLNGCTDNTLSVVQKEQEKFGNLKIIDLKDCGKGLATKAGFEDALRRDSDLIGFVDADMATLPQFFYELMLNMRDVTIASRYMPGAKVFPPRSLLKRWGSRIVYESLVRALFGLSYYDLQCGAKLFKRGVIETVLPHMTERQWAFDVELLYLCKKFGFSMRELPTVWYERDGSKLRLSAGFLMLFALVRLRFAHSFFGRAFKRD